MCPVGHKASQEKVLKGVGKTWKVIVGVIYITFSRTNQICDCRTLAVLSKAIGSEVKQYRTAKKAFALLFFYALLM